MTGSGQPDPIRVLIVDDQHLVRAGFRMLLESEEGMEVVGEAADGRAAISAARTERPDVILMDIRMPVMDGIAATREILGGRGGTGGSGSRPSPSPGAGEVDTGDGDGPSQRPPRVLVLTTFDLDEHVFDALRAGASGFLLKDVPPEELVAALRTVAAGEALLAPSVTRRLIDEFVERPAVPRRDEAIADLTEREAEVLGHVARGLSNAEVAAALYVSETTVKTHVSRVLMKLDLRDRVQAVVFAYENGLVQPGAAEGGG